jgi:hypothetical protein
LRRLRRDPATSLKFARLIDLGGTILPGSPADLETLMAAETDKWGKVVKFAGIKPE